MGGGQSHGVADEQVEAEGFVADGELVPVGQLGQVAHQVGQLLELHQDVVDQDRAIGGRELVDPADDLEIGAQAGEGRPELVGGVHDQLDLGPAGELEGLEQPVEGAAEASELVGAARREAAGDVGGPRQVLHRVGEGVEWHERGLGHQPTENDRQQDPDEGDGAQDDPQAVQFGAHVDQGGDLEGPALGEIERAEQGPGRQGLDQFAELVAPDVDGGEEGRGLPGGHQPRLGGYRQLAPGHEGALRIDDLSERGGGGGDLLAGGDLLGRRGQGVVGRAEQRIAGGQKRCGGGDEHGDHDGHRGGQDEACAEGHVPRRTYPTPRTVCMHRGSPPASVLRRRYPT